MGDDKELHQLTEAAIMERLAEFDRIQDEIERRGEEAKTWQEAAAIGGEMLAMMERFSPLFHEILDRAIARK